MTDPQNVGTTYGYDVLNRLKFLAFNGQSFGFAYDALSRRTSLIRPNGVTTSYSYDAGSNLLSALHKKGTHHAGWSNVHLRCCQQSAQQTGQSHRHGRHLHL